MVGLGRDLHDGLIAVPAMGFPLEGHPTVLMS